MNYHATETPWANLQPLGRLVLRLLISILSSQYANYIYRSAKTLTLLRTISPHPLLAGTRKTTPSFRLVEKYGMLVGGIDAHRHDLSSMIMLKDNHIASVGSIPLAIAAAKRVGGFSLKIEVEVASEDDAWTAISNGADVVMLDNFKPAELREVAGRLKERMKKEGYGKVLLECSGGLTEENVQDYVTGDVDIYSTSSVHQGVAHVDFSLKIVKGVAAV
jgi:nicotinate-nucleotide pyrophosphorylase (carboxylating)